MRWGEDHIAWLIGLLLVVAIFVFFLVVRANAHDPKRPELDKWFDSLSSEMAGLCCNGREAKALDDSDWDTKDAHYRVRLDGNWYDVPERSLVKQRNLVGHALVWVSVQKFYNGETRTVIRCFMPGTWS
jgi:hypothetical protein